MIVAVILLAGLGALAEAAARWALRRRNAYYRYVPRWRQQNEFDAELFPRFPPTAWMEINSDGERGGPPPRSDERAFRALVVGGSAAESVYLDQRATWAAVVQRVLDEPEHRVALGGVTRVHVGNVARAILPCEQVTLLLRKILPRYRRLDLILIMVGGSDLAFWMERGAPPVLPEEAIPLDKIFEQHPEGPWGFRPRRTALWRLAANLRRRLRPPVIVERDASGWLRETRKMRAEAPHRIDDVPDPTPMLARFERHLGDLIALARTRCGRVILVRQPWFAPPHTPGEEALLWNFGRGRPYREKVDTYFTPRVVDALMHRVDERAVAVAVAAGIETIDLMSVLPRTDRTFYDELHFNPEGAEMAGRAVAAAILAGPRR